MRKIAIILFNLGGPDGPNAVRPFLFNLFNDKAIIAAPQPVRFALATLISTLRESTAKQSYAHMGGGSPILPETQKQAAALEAKLAQTLTGVEAKVFIAMRYWKPFAKDAAQAARAWGADEALLLPLYPQFSTTTTATARDAWAKAWPGKTRTVCCYPAGDNLATAHADAIMKAWREGGAPASPRVLFSAHGLPKRVIEAGDPYQWQVEQTAAAVRAKLPAEWDFRVCYQSRVGPLEWIGPSTLEEVQAAGRDNNGVIVCPIAFVSEHVETLVELDIDYAERAKQEALPFYLRAQTPGVAAAFIEGLSSQVARMIGGPDIQSERGARLCPNTFSQCPMRAAS